ncbi:MAG: hypothetical protein EP343_16430 [Deltaproteobacteria bacterium]|nr:MAG: hypothetical protein EP343_16430 [Deltaproteobacteria bacterium]
MILKLEGLILMVRYLFSQRKLVCLLWVWCVVLVVGGLGSTSTCQAHTLVQARVVHILVAKKRVEFYVNFLMPKRGKAILWKRLYDRNRNGKLEPGEQQMLGEFFAKRYLSRFSLWLDGAKLTMKLREVQNSRLRGNPARGSYAWDYHFSAVQPDYVGSSHKLKLSIPILFEKEMIPVALASVDSQTLKATSSSYLLRRKTKTRAVCRMDRKRQSCLFAWEDGPPLRPATRPTSRPRP